MKTSAFILAMAPIVVTLSGCADPTVWVKPLAASECLAADPQWTELPDSDVTRSQVSRNYQTNKEAFKSMRSNRAICRAGLKAAQDKG